MFNFRQAYGAMLLECFSDRSQKGRWVNRFWKEIAGSFLHRIHRQSYIASRRNENDWQSAPLGFQPSLKLKARYPRHTNIGHKTGGSVPGMGTEKLFRGIEADREHSLRLDQIL